MVAEDLTKHFEVERGFLSTLEDRFSPKRVKFVHAVCHLDLQIRKGESLGLVGESGSGKSTLGRCIMRLYSPTKGRVFFEGQEISLMHGSQLKLVRRQMQIIFQDPFASLNPRLKIGEIIGGPMKYHGITNGSSQTEEKVVNLLETVGLNGSQINRYPHMFSGGQRQRIAIARALSLSPKFIVADEPVSALDVSIQAQILDLMVSLKEEFGLTYLFISHNLDVVQYISNRIAVMYMGKLVEVAETDEFFKNPLHPYSKALLSAIPVADPRIRREQMVLQGEIPSSLSPPVGCRFNTRCPYVMDKCRKEEPKLVEIYQEHSVACFLLSNESVEREEQDETSGEADSQSTVQVDRG